jgi:hypothetical protein
MNINKSLTILRKKSNRNLRKIKSGYKTRKSMSHPNLIGNFNHLSTSYKVYLFNKLSPEIIVATSHVCEPDYGSDFLPDILSDEGNFIFLLVKNKSVIGFIIANHNYYDKKCTTRLNNTFYIKLLCLQENKRGLRLFPIFLNFVEQYIHNHFFINHIRLTANNIKNYSNYLKLGFIPENNTNYECEYSMIKHIE